MGGRDPEEVDRGRLTEQELGLVEEEGSTKDVAAETGMSKGKSSPLLPC